MPSESPSTPLPPPPPPTLPVSTSGGTFQMDAGQGEAQAVSGPAAEASPHGVWSSLGRLSSVCPAGLTPEAPAPRRAPPGRWTALQRASRAGGPRSGWWPWVQHWGFQVTRPDLCPLTRVLRYDSDF